MSRFWECAVVSLIARTLYSLFCSFYNTRVALCEHLLAFTIVHVRAGWGGCRPTWMFPSLATPMEWDPILICMIFIEKHTQLGDDNPLIFATSTVSVAWIMQQNVYINNLIYMSPGQCCYKNTFLASRYFAKLSNSMTTGYRQLGAQFHQKNKGRVNNQYGH